MGCWGITALESDSGLDAMSFIRKQLPANGQLDLGTLVEALKADGWNAPADSKDAESHTSPMALAEIMVHFLDGDVATLDSDYIVGKGGNRFSDIVSFTTSKETMEWLRDYLADTLAEHRKYAALANPVNTWGGWFQEKDWLDWQNHMETLVGRLTALLPSFTEPAIDLLSAQKQEQQQSVQLDLKM